MTMSNMKIFLATGLAISIGVLSACAQYEVRTNKAFNYSARVERLFVWSAIGEVPLLGTKRGLQSDSFENNFKAALKRTLERENVPVEIRPFTPKNDTFESLARFEQDLKPNMRLLIQPLKYQTVSFRGGTSVSGLWLDLSLYETATGRRVWRGQLFVDPALDVTAWGEGGAEKLANQVADALKKDKLI